MTFREAQCLLMLYRACHDVGVRQRAIKLVPELNDWEETLTYETSRPRRRRLVAFDGAVCAARHLGYRFVICRDEDLDEHKRDFALSFDLARDVTVTAEDA